MFIQRSFLPIFISMVFALETEGQNLLNNYQQFMEAYNQKDYNRCAQVGRSIGQVHQSSRYSIQAGGMSLPERTSGCQPYIAGAASQTGPHLHHRREQRIFTFT